MSNAVTQPFSSIHNTVDRCYHCMFEYLYSVAIYNNWCVLSHWKASEHGRKVVTKPDDHSDEWADIFSDIFGVACVPRVVSTSFNCNAFLVLVVVLLDEHDLDQSMDLLPKG
ncbi:hypothetical protein DPMN_050452 [Dreissena polymorpha]|uniref:Uncharacterized protein n=1 Tax=Dreissena polymorpha TaxID=45954 RepID=A0A9D4HN30_DREPO|nr:hypothetical protein DPMN_050452 [Dreissena polymorpha]